MKAVIGLGNPGVEYDGTRHNIGFDVVDELARRWSVHLRSWRSVAKVAKVPSRDIVLAAPTTFMNASGQAVEAIAAFYHIEPADVLVVVDEVQLPLGKLRLRRGGSAGGHNGLKSVIAHVGSEFPRLRIGIERGHPDSVLSDRVLSKFAASEKPIVRQAVERAADAVETFLAEGLETAMNRHNVSEDRTSEEEKQ